MNTSSTSIVQVRLSNAARILAACSALRAVKGAK